jgi:hypothetical protein
MMEEQDADGTRKSLGDLEATGRSIQPSEPDAVVPCSTTLAREFSDSFKRTPGSQTVEVDAEVLASLLILFLRLRGETHSGDKVALAVYAAQSEAEKLGIDSEVFFDVVMAMEEYGGSISRRNPISGMF